MARERFYSKVLGGYISLPQENVKEVLRGGRRWKVGAYVVDGKWHQAWKSISLTAPIPVRKLGRPKRIGAQYQRKSFRATRPDAVGAGTSVVKKSFSRHPAYF